MSRNTGLKADLDRIGYELGGAHLTRQARSGTFNTFAKVIRQLGQVIRCAKQIGGRHLKAEMLQALWSILSAFVDLSFGVDSVHLARPQVRDEDASNTDTAAETIQSAHQPGNPVAKEVEP